MLVGEYRDFAFDESRAPQNRGLWRQEIFKTDANCPLDLEIGTGNGFHFGHYASKNKDRCLVGIELKFKPLIQSIRRPLRVGLKNARIVRFDAKEIEKLFADQELNNVMIHFPDPWELGPQWKHRLISDEFLKKIHSIQRSGSFVEFKTDSANYFRWTLERFVRSEYQIECVTTHLHQSRLVQGNFVTAFEDIFMRKGLRIHYIKVIKN
ncbi:MAG: tRNA (guanine-N7)-methyltransferase [Proteobacteria bacterium SG_bin7]|nr:MAG: tRNA (guanine-N7)-methyltransferase [Proteobacteria bacterium SG_bin7]